MTKGPRRTIPQIPTIGNPLKLLVVVIIAMGLSALITWLLIDTRVEEKSLNEKDKPRVKSSSLPIVPVVSEVPQVTPLDEETDLKGIPDGGIGELPSQQKEQKPKLKRGLDYANLPQGTIEPTVVQEFIKSHSREVQKCYERILRNNNMLQGSLVVEAIIDPSGRVVHTTISKDSLYDTNVKQCVLTTFKSWNFPQPKGGYVTISVPFNFTPKFE